MYCCQVSFSTYLHLYSPYGSVIRYYITKLLKWNNYHLVSSIVKYRFCTYIFYSTLQNIMYNQENKIKALIKANHCISNASYLLLKGWRDNVNTTECVSQKTSNTQLQQLFFAWVIFTFKATFRKQNLLPSVVIITIFMWHK